jgi:putative heme-binding domain-containing protein
MASRFRMTATAIGEPRTGATHGLGVSASRLLPWIVFLACASGGENLWAQRELRDIPDPDPELERQSFQLADGLEVNLFAADPLLAKPIHMNFDAAGRLWVASSEVYPQVTPGQVANDKILVLQDADGDGRAEKTTVFADGLLIPTGVQPGDGGAYVANSTELLYLKDTNGDGRADTRRVMLSGFGTEDTHHILHTLRWGPDGMLYFNQSIYIHSHVETPHGVRRLNSGGIWQFRPETMQLEVFTRGLCNPWGHIVDHWGQSFATDGAGGEGINYVFPGATLFTYAGAKKVLKGLNPGSPKHCGLEVVSGRHAPDDWQGDLITSDFRAHRVCRFKLSETGAGYASREQAEVIKTSHAAFRPIDAKMGPDGALYVADWYNPIIQHGEVDFRDERRDHTHGRIWRVTFKGRPLVERPNVPGATIDQLLALLAAPEDSTRLAAKLELKSRGATEVVGKLDRWVGQLDPVDDTFEHLRLEALWTYQALDVAQPPLVAALARSKDHHVRAAAARVLGRWHPRVPEAVDLLTALVADEHPQVRLEAVRALGELRTAESAELAARALDRDVDRFMDHALWLAARELGPYWLPALEAGKLSFDGNAKQLTFFLQAVDSPLVVGPLMQLIAGGKLPADRRESVLLLVAALGGPSELRTLFDMSVQADTPPPLRTALLAALAKAAVMRKVQPAGDLAAISPLIDSTDEALRVAAIDAAGQWRLAPLGESFTRIASDPRVSDTVRRSALRAFAALGAASMSGIQSMCQPSRPENLRAMAIAALATLDVKSASGELVRWLGESSGPPDPAPIVTAILDRKGGAVALSEIVAAVKLPPDSAKLAIRAVRSAAREEPELVAALSTAGGLKTSAGPVSAAEIKKLVDEVAASGNAARGEAVFRRGEQGCLKCHAIAGAGGRVGPDLVSIGASAQVDYLVESILQPSAKIKENYHSLTVVADGRILSGVRVRESNNELVLRDVEDREVAIPLDTIEQRQEAGSLMPVGLADSLTRGELIDLVRFLSELGKVGPYANSQARVARRWQVLASASDTMRLAKDDRVDISALDHSDANWASLYSRVSGDLPLDAVATVSTPAENKVPAEHARPCILRCQLEVVTGGTVELAITGPVERAWLDGIPIALHTKLAVDVAEGLHTLMLFTMPAADRTLRLELNDVPGSPAQVQIVGGK